jgi:heat shock protein HslJ
LAFVAACGDTQEQAIATSLPVVQATATTVPTAELTEEPTAPTAEPESAGDVTSVPWLWSSFTSPVEQFEVEAPENYVVTFNDDGTVNINADCNSAMGSYTSDGGSLAIEIGR